MSPQFNVVQETLVTRLCVTRAQEKPRRTPRKGGNRTRRGFPGQGGKRTLKRGRLITCSSTSTWAKSVLYVTSKVRLGVTPYFA